MRLLTRLVTLVLLTGFLVSAPPPLAAATTDTFRDEFNNISYSGDDGVGGSWAGSWWESEAPTDPTGGDVTVGSDAAVADFVLRFNNNGTGDYIERTADLSAYNTATLSFDYRRSPTDSAFSFKVWASANGPAGPFTEISSLAGAGDDAVYVGSGNLDVTAYRSATTTIRFSHEAGSLAVGKDFYLDNVEISATTTNSPPIAADDGDSTAPNTPVTIDVLTNDSDADLDPLLVDSATQGANGSVVNNGTTVTYTPNPGWRGLDTFTYTATDGNGGFDTASVTVGVGGVCYLVGDGGGADGLALVNLGSGLESVVGATGTSGITAAAIHPLTGTFYASLPGQLGTIDIATGAFTPTAAPFDGGFDNIQAIAFDSDGSLYAFHHRAGPKDLLIRVDPSTGAFIPDAFGTGVDSVSLDSFWATQKSVVGIDINASGQMYGVTSNDGPSYNIQWIDKSSGSAFAVWVASATVDVSFDATGRLWMLSPTGTLREPFGSSIGLSGLAGYQAVACEGGLNNQSPSATGDADTASEDTAVTIDVLANDTDADLDSLVVDAVTDGLNGSVTNNGLDVTYTPDPDWNGTDTFSYTVSDGRGGFASAQVTVTVVAQPDPPVAVDDADTTPEDTAVPIDVLANDTDADLDVLLVDSVTQGSNGSVTNNATDVTYTPNPGWSGTDTFTYTVSDGNGGLDTATVTVTISAVNDDPVAVDDSGNTTEDTGMTVDVLGNDTDPELDLLSIDSVTQGANGSVVNNSTDVTYTPNLDWNGVDTFTYTASDGNGGFAVAQVTVTVTAQPDPPVAVDDADTTPEDTAVNVDVLANDSDPDLDALSVDSVTQGAYGSVVNYGTDVTYDPDPGWSGVDTFTYTVTDGNGGFAVAQVTVTVTAQPDPPVAVDDAGTTPEDTPATVDVLANDSDPDLDVLVVDSVTQGASGSVVNNGTDVTYTPNLDWNGVDTFTYTASDGNGGFATGTVIITVTPVNDDPVAVGDTKTVDEDSSQTIPVLGNDSDIDGDPLTITGVVNGSNGTAVNNGTNVTYIPNPDWSGVDTFMYTVSDGNGGSASATVTVTVTPVNDDPLGLPDATSTLEDTPVVVDVLANDTDVDSSVLTITAVTNGTGGTVTTDGATVTYTPEPDWNGTDAFTYRVSDELGGWCETTVTVIVSPVNDPPLALDDPSTTPRDTAVYVWVLANDSDPDLDDLSVSAVTNGSNGAVVNNGSKVTYTPAAGWSGVDTFTYTVSDGNGGSDSATVTVSVTAGPNRPPVATDDSTVTDEDTPVTIPVLANDSDPDGDTVTVSAVNQGAHGSATKTAISMTYTPDKDWSGMDSFSYTIADGRGGTATAAVVITVKPVNDAPAANNDSASTPGATTVIVPVLANDSDVDGDTLAVTTVSQGSYGATATDGVNVTYAPSSDWSGTDSFSYTITDGQGGFGSASVTVTVTDTTANNDPAAVVPVATRNQPPVITVIGETAVADGARLRLEISAEDPEGDQVSISATGLPGWVSLVDYGDGRATLTGIPWSGADSSTEITITASDGTITAKTIVVIEVIDGNRPPRIGSIIFNGVNGDGSFSFTITASDPDGDPLAVSTDDLPPWATLTDHGGGSATISSNGVPDDAIGSFSVVVSVTDGQTTVTSSLLRPIADLRNGRPPELTHQAFEVEGADTLVATALKPFVATPNPLNAHLTPREGLMVAFGSAVETLKNQVIPAVVLGVVMAWMLMIGVGRTKKEEEGEPA